MLRLDPNQAATVPRGAATVIVVREAGDRSLEVLCVRRHERSGFLGGAVVFPGGKIDEADGDPRWSERTSAPDPRADLLADAGVSARTIAIAACREAAEEAAIAPIDALGGAALLEIQAELLAGQAFIEVLARRGARLDLKALVPFARWVTPIAEARRFDARFFLLALPEGQVGAHDDKETTASFWARPAEIIRQFEAGALWMAPPTCRSLELLATCATAAEAMALAREQSLLPICPQLVPDESAPFLALPGDPAHEVQEARVAGKTRFVLRHGRFLSEDPP